MQTACETKFNNLKRAYVACVDHNNTSGNNPKNCAFYAEMHDLFHKDDAVSPVILYSNRQGCQKRDSDIKDTSDAVQSDDTDSITDEERVAKEPAKKRKIAGQRENELAPLFKDFMHSREKNENEKLKKIEEMHNEEMAFMGRFLQVFEKSLEKIVIHYFFRVSSICSLDTTARFHLAILR